MNEELRFLLISQLELIGRLLLATVCGFIIGYERKNRNKEAGVRTHVIVALASCLMMEISKYGFADTGDFDGARLAAQVVSGIGFLGAGMIFVHKNSIKGLTTAAGIWATSGIGMSIGAGMYIIGVLTTFLMVALQIILHKNPRFLTHNATETLVFVATDTCKAMDYVENLLTEYHLLCENVSIIKLSNDDVQIEANVSYHDSFDMFGLSKKAMSEPIIKSVCNGSLNHLH
ncbi:MAG: MgtC/SapB family protein [Clostridia bacterium]|nr:MgtC/SapB family protein [Clostridia bacterium]